MGSNQSRSGSSVRVRRIAPAPSASVVALCAFGPRRRPPTRDGLLRRAPRLSVRGERRATEWRVIAGGIGGALDGVVRMAPAAVVPRARPHAESIPDEWPWGPGADCA